MQIIYAIGMILLLTGVIVVIIAVVVLALSGVKPGTKVKGGGVILIGPIPIVFGSDKESVKKLLLLSLALMIVALILIVTLNMLGRW